MGPDLASGSAVSALHTRHFLGHLSVMRRFEAGALPGFSQLALSTLGSL